jgi:hypothetical protein
MPGTPLKILYQSRWDGMDQTAKLTKRYHDFWRGVALPANKDGSDTVYSALIRETMLKRVRSYSDGSVSWMRGDKVYLEPPETQQPLPAVAPKMTQNKEKEEERKKRKPTPPAVVFPRNLYSSCKAISFSSLIGGRESAVAGSYSQMLSLTADASISSTERFPAAESAAKVAAGALAANQSVSAKVSDYWDSEAFGDRIKITPVVSPNVLVNPSFELVLGPEWVPVRCRISAVDSSVTPPHHGLMSLRAVGRDGSYVYQDVSLTRGKRYRITCVGKAATAYYLKVGTPFDINFYSPQVYVFSFGSWAHATKEITTPLDTVGETTVIQTRVALYVYGFAPRDTMTTYFDDVEIVEVYDA